MKGDSARLLIVNLDKRKYRQPSGKPSRGAGGPAVAVPRPLTQGSPAGKQLDVSEEVSLLFDGEWISLTFAGNQLRWDGLMSKFEIIRV